MDRVPTGPRSEKDVPSPMWPIKIEKDTKHVETSPASKVEARSREGPSAAGCPEMSTTARLVTSQYED